ncbi:pilus assembly protein TadG-related protein [Mesorhizobium sp. CA18]|uniref:TadE/TadG family type IV pilus assembly protein n=1 Tax=unclassified Mesorhizobium TaxID=325217 RepID=UPI001CCB3BAA|nr:MULTISPECIES: pilus assembly protein TadG-related protein [unclassified Mesorhizobium]MBZ9734395.1 pilus assembly protein TadG-related protein [Mesorhizobium sp. CA9]MBZ9824676.1 pilus assembly protein TadG-related protein [Mesorhizobium sp. CA18]MBZ9829366.1 pilus assembly protein TadG-related protein [Mesorhizobium sp. CA2]MBZ9837084.1 pilus assembly protein TadG-related protein [Mesorhizobium sp. CA3]MBZ9878044.1 pilus assembly protein TadG-related protein [Mesorhizobium sp. Ca11]
MLRTIREFWNDQRGIAMILVAIMLPALVGFAVLALDMSRANGLHSDLQKGVDALALAGAAELDGNSDAWTRAERALTNLVSNDTIFADAGVVTLPSTGSTTVNPTYSACRSRGQISWCFLANIPTNDSSPITSANYAATAGATKFIQVTAQPESFTAMFPVSYLSGSSANSFNVGAEAVAGFTNALCQFTPMFICNPYTSLGALQTAVSGTSKPMIWLKEQTGGNNAQYGPGNYGFLSSPEGDKSAQKLTEMFAVTSPPACYSQNGVQTRPGNVTPVNDGINTRFDIYPNGNSGKLIPSSAPPAPNVRKGMVVKNNGGSCSYDLPNSGQINNYKALPRDNCFYSGTCTQAGVLGNGAWDFAGYWSVNHGNASTTGVLTACGANPSRYCVYKYEIDNPTLKSGQEKTPPQCNTTTQLADRRLLYVAIVDCVANNVQGGGQTLPVQAFASVFVTETAGGPPNADIYGEIQDISTTVGQGTLKKLQRNEAQLYR